MGQFLCIFMWGWLLVASAAATAAQRAFEVNDLFEIEDIGHYYGGPCSFSKDGQQLAFTRVRAQKSLANHKWEYLWGNAGADVWVQLRSRDTPVNITHGVADGSGWWAPQWSPDAKRLAVLSTRGGNTYVWIWDARSGSLRQLSRRGDAARDELERPYLWVDNRHLLFPALPVGDRALAMRIELQTPKIAVQEWPKVVTGQESTANVLESGVPVDLTLRPQDDLMLIDVVDGNERVVAHGATRSWQLSPDGQAVAFTRQTSLYLPKAEDKLAVDSATFSTLEVAALDGRLIVSRGNISRDVLVDSVRWSPDSKEIAFLGYAEDRDHTARLYRLNLATQDVTTYALDGLDPTPIVHGSAGIEWTDAHELLLYAGRSSGDRRPDVMARRDWWVVHEKGGATCLTTNMREAPEQLWAEQAHRAFVGLGGQKIWEIVPSSATVTDLTATLGSKVKAIVWPSATDSGTDSYAIKGQVYNQIVFALVGGGRETFDVLDLPSGAINQVPNPAPGAQLSAYAPTTHTGIFYVADRTGLQIWRSTLPNGPPQVLATANAFLRDISESKFQSIEYASLSGEKLRGWLLLPDNYRAGRRYPVLTRVYPGTIYNDVRPSQMGINSSASLNLQIAVAHGYVVLLPSMPLSPEGVSDDPMLRAAEGVLPAVDKAIELGIADQERLFLIGQSFGGFAAYALVTQTQRFKAVVSLAGLSDLISLYSQFDARYRYTDHPQEYPYMAALMESAQTRMGSPPWKDLGRYIRNSPVMSIDRVRTPVMIIQGDMDYVALQQGEEFFNSLYRQGKRASFVRYWGEGHVLESPANIRDMWRRIIDWFDDFGDILRDQRGDIIFDGDQAKSRRVSEAWESSTSAR